MKYMKRVIEIILSVDATERVSNADINEQVDIVKRNVQDHFRLNPIEDVLTNPNVKITLIDIEEKY